MICFFRWTTPCAGMLARILFFLLPLLLSACQKPAEIKPTFVHQDAHSSGNLVQIASDSKLGVSAGLGGGLRLWDLTSGQLVAGWQAHDGPVNGVAVLQSQGRLISGGWDGQLKQWGLSGQLLNQVQTGSPVTAMVTDPVAKVLVTGHADASIRYWGLSRLQLQRVTQLEGSRIKSLGYHAASGGYAASDIRGKLWYWSKDQMPVQIADLSSYVRSLAFSSDGKRLFGGSWFDLYRWELPSGKMTVLDTDHRGIIADIAWSSVNQDIVSISRQTDASVLALDPETGETRVNYGEHDLCGASIDISSDGKYLMTTSDDASVRIWQLQRSELQGP